MVTPKELHLEYFGLLDTEKDYAIAVTTATILVGV
jgi:hypothetical protein